MKDNLFKLIRQEEVVLFAGAGLSLSSGYPSGKELRRIILTEFSQEEKVHVNTDAYLPDLSEEFIRIKNSRNPLIRILNTVFDRTVPEATVYNKIATISHFKTIITTNYDYLFQKAYGKAAQIIFRDADIAYLENQKKQIFKIHGCLSDPDSILISKSDYNNFFARRTDESGFWTVVKERLFTKCILFVGYNLEDPNIEVIFERLNSEIGVHKREAFLIAPNLPNHKVIDLAKKGINYIDSTAELFIDELIENIKDNIFHDFDNGKVNPETFREFLSCYRLAADLDSNADAYKVAKVKSLDGDLESVGSFTINGTNIIQQFQNFVTSNTVKNLVIPKENLLGFEVKVNGLKYLEGSEEQGQLVLSRVPTQSIVLDVEFSDGFEICEVPVDIYAGNNMINIYADLKVSILEINMDFTLYSEFKKVNYTLNTKDADFFQNVKEGLKLYRFYSRLFNGIDFKVYKNGSLLTEKNVPINEDASERAVVLLEYFENLILIQENFSVQFENIDFATIQDNFEMVSNLALIANNKVVKYIDSDVISVNISENQDIDLFNQQLNTNRNNKVEVVYNEIDEVQLYGQKISLGYKTLIIFQPFIFKDEEDGLKIKVKSLSKNYGILYSKLRK